MVEIIFVLELMIIVIVSGDCVFVMVVYEVSLMGEGFIYVWDFFGGDLFISDEVVVMVVYVEVGIYVVILIVMNVVGLVLMMLSDDIVVFLLLMVFFISDYVLGV